MKIVNRARLTSVNSSQEIDQLYEGYVATGRWTHTATFLLESGDQLQVKLNYTEAEALVMNWEKRTRECVLTFEIPDL